MTAMHGGHVRGPLFLPIARDGGGSEISPMAVEFGCCRARIWRLSGKCCL